MRKTIAALLVGAALSLTPSISTAQTAADVAAARELFNEGSRLAKEEKWEQAADRYERSYELSQQPITLYSLGFVRQKLGLNVEAVESYRAFLAQQSSPKTASYVEPAKAAIAELEPKLARVSVSIEPADVNELRLEVNGTVVPKAAFGVARLVNAGDVSVRVSAPGYRAKFETVRVSEGGSESLELRLEPLPPGEKPEELPPESPVDQKKPDTPDDGPSLVLPISLMAGGGAVAGVGLVVGLIGVSEASDAPTQDGPEADSAKTKSLVGDIMVGVGAAAAAVGVVILLVGGDDGAPQAALVPQPGGAMLTGRF